MSQEEAAPRIVVRDRRKFSADGSRRDSANPAPGKEGRREERREEPTGQPTPASDGAAGKPTEMPASPPAEKPPGEAPSPKAAEAPSPKADPRFRQLVSLLFSQAAVLLEAESRTAAEGKPPPPTDPETLAGLQTVIGLFEVIEEKTRGRLAPGDASLLSQVLYQLRMAYMERAGTPGP